MAVLLLGFLHQYRKNYLRHWTLSWAALAGYYVASSIGMGLGLHSNVSSANPIRILTAMLSGVFGYASIAWLLFGIYELLRRRPVRIRAYWRTLAVVAAIGVVTSGCVQELGGRACSGRARARARFRSSPFAARAEASQGFSLSRGRAPAHSG